MTIVIPYRTSRWQDTELKYALRSAVAYLPAIGNIFIIGDRPAWLKNVIHIPATDEVGPVVKEQNVYNKLMLACKDEWVSDDFIMLNDDHFLLPGFNITKSYAMLWGERISETYQYTVDNTQKIISSSYNYDTHCPCVFNKKKFIEIMALADWDIKFGYCMKTLYAYGAGLPAKIVTDLKFKNEELRKVDIWEAIKGRYFFSIGENMRTGAMAAVLESLYPNKTIYE